jgi:uroporphyrinogen decarboxylase
MLLTSVGWANSYYANETYNSGKDSYTDEWGIGWRNSRYSTRFGDGFYTEIVGHPLADDAAIAGYKAPDPERSGLYAESEWVLRTFRDEYWIVGVTVTTIFETAWALRGYERILMDFVSDPDRADAILDIPFRYHLRAAERLVRKAVDMIWIGRREHLLRCLSPDTWRRFLKPRMAAFISTIKRSTRSSIIFRRVHLSIIPFDRVGVDILNPVQPLVWIRALEEGIRNSCASGAPWTSAHAAVRHR